ncbi:type 1 periplasmic binding fold superfamily protein [Winogradskyella sp. A2]|uniref:type 1 periplasmic binding fold superfamily protein n=1 Tax=Winogradskyella sp. A2 TaxID=3366944 RepID=UPI00398C7088
MKTIKHLLILFLSIGLFTACSDDDDPAPVNEEEVITTMTLSLQAVGGGTPILFQSRDADGDGPNAPVVTVSGSLTANTTYGGSIVFLNELESPADNITAEVQAEEEEHQVFYSFNGASGTTINYNDSDMNGNPVGLSITLASGDAATGNTLTVVLKHEPTKPNDGTAIGAGGETDIEATFTYDVN